MVVWLFGCVELDSSLWSLAPVVDDNRLVVMPGSRSFILVSELALTQLRGHEFVFRLRLSLDRF